MVSPLPKRYFRKLSFSRTPITSRLLSPARAASPSQRRRHASEMSNPEFALYMEKEHLRTAEEDDYNIMENLIQRRLVSEVHRSLTYWHPRSVRDVIYDKYFGNPAHSQFPILTS